MLLLYTLHVEYVLVEIQKKTDSLGRASSSKMGVVLLGLFIVSHTTKLKPFILLDKRRGLIELARAGGMHL